MFIALNNFLQELDTRTFYKYIALFLAAILLLMGIILFVHRSKVNNLQKQVAKLNTQRKEIQQLLTTFERVKQQKAEVDALLEKDKNFKIVGYFDDLLSHLHLTDHKSELQQSEETLEHMGAYSEIKIVVVLRDINTQQLAELLQQIEKNERIYMKALTITKSPTKPSIDVTLTVGTVQPRVAEEENV